MINVQQQLIKITNTKVKLNQFNVHSLMFTAEKWMRPAAVTSLSFFVSVSIVSDSLLSLLILTAR